jgi:DNA polymerase (family 10)
MNCSPQRLDLKDTHARLARQLGCKIVIDTDSHRTTELALRRFGIEQARRAGLGPQDVLNTLPYEEFRAAMKRRP